MDDESKIHTCTYKGCSAAFTRPFRLNLHLLTHNNFLPYHCPEQACEKRYTNKSHLDRHLSSVHSKNDDAETEVLYSCPLCLKKYANRQNLKRHVKTNHLLRELFTCDFCKVEFKKKHQLSAHMYVHTGIKAFSCEVCGNGFVTLFEKKRHMRCHKTYECPRCLLIFKQWSKCQKHVKTEHLTEEYICNTCGRVFKNRSHFLRHLKLHDVKSFQCPYENCTKYYSRKSNLRQHILVKHENVTHNCTICDAKLSTKRKLLDHIQIRHLSEPKIRIPKTRATGRKIRKDAGILKVSTAVKLAGLPQKTEEPREGVNLVKDNVAQT